MDCDPAPEKETEQKFDTVVIYHGGCADGTAAAWCLSLMLDNTRTLYHAGKPGESDGIPDCVDCEVYFVDFCYPSEVIRELLTKAKSIRVLDHHATTKPVLDLLPHDRLNVTLDDKRSGAQLAFDYVISQEAGNLYLFKNWSPLTLECSHIGATHFSPDPSKETEKGYLSGEEYSWLSTQLAVCRRSNTRMWFIDDIADRDLWEWKIPGSRDRTKAMFFHGVCGMVNGYYDLFNQRDKLDIDRLEIEGGIINAYDESRYAGICHGAIDVTVREPIASMPVRARLVQCHWTDASDVGARLVADEKVHFAVVYRYDFPTDKWHCSVRSRKAQVSVDLTKLLPKLDPKAGGHPSAAGMTLKSLRDAFVQADAKFADAVWELVE